MRTVDMLSVQGGTRDIVVFFGPISIPVGAFSEGFRRFGNDGVSFRLNPRLDRQNVKVSIEILNAKGVSVHNFSHSGMPAVPNLPAVKSITKHPFSNGRYHARITLEGQLAFESEMRLGPILF
jgi:hypothetical protein